LTPEFTDTFGIIRSFETLDSALLDAPRANALIRPSSLAIVEMPIVAATPQPVRMNPRREITALADATTRGVIFDFS
jgi:hypothetical protein